MSNTNPEQAHYRPCPPPPPRWAVAHLLRAVSNPGTASRKRLLGRLGYANNGKAARKIDTAVWTGDVGTDLQRRLPLALDVSAETVAAAINRTRQQQHEYERTVDSWCEALERREFRPHIVVDNDIRQRRVPIFAIAMFCNTEVLKYDVPAGQVLLPEDEQLAKMPTLIRDYLHSEDNERRKLFFRDPVGYTYCPTYDDAWDFDTNGKLLRRKPGPVRPGHAVARIGKKLVSGTGHPSGPAR